MDKIRIKKNILEGDSIIITLTNSFNNLGDINSVDEETTININENIYRYRGVSRLEECKSFDVNNPYIEGVNGVKKIDGDIISYEINDTLYETNINTNETYIKIKNKIISNNHNHYVRNYVGLINTNIEHEINVNRGNISVMESFLRIKDMNDITDFNQTGFGFYKIYNKTI